MPLRTAEKTRGEDERVVHDHLKPGEKTTTQNKGTIRRACAEQERGEEGRPTAHSLQALLPPHQLSTNEALNIRGENETSTSFSSPGTGREESDTGARLGLTTNSLSIIGRTRGASPVWLIKESTIQQF